MSRLSQFCDRHRRRNTHASRGRRVCGLPVIGTVLLAGCSLAPVIAEQSGDYNTTVETVTNNILITNILRARDGAPLYFSDLSQIRGLVQLNLAAQTTVPYGPVFPGGVGGSVQPGPLAINSQPGFDFAPLNTKKFAEGMLEGIDPKVFAYFIQRASFIQRGSLNIRMFLNLVIFKIEKYRKTGDDKYSLQETCFIRVDAPTGRCRDWINSWTRGIQPFIGLLSKETPLGPPIPAEILANQGNTLRNLVQVSAADLDLDLTKSKKAYQLSQTTSKFVLCVCSGRTAARHYWFDAVGIAATGATKEPKPAPVPTKNGTCDARSASPDRYVIYTRSVETIFYYLGALLKLPGTPPIAFHIYDHPVDGARFHTDYRGKTYFVLEAQDDGSDSTVTILAMLNDLLNLNRDANEIPSTKTVATQ
jgi:hypothetical protein